MSSNVYEDPDLKMKTRHSRGVREEDEEKVEKQVDIYDSIVTVTGRQGDRVTHDGSPAVQTNPLRGAALTLAALCVLLFVGISVLYGLYVTVESENNRLITEKERNPTHTYCSDGEQTEGGATSWQVFDCSCYYVSTDKKDWTDSRTDCQRRGADLVTVQNKDKQDLVRGLSRHGDSWIGLQSVATHVWSEEWRWVDGAALIYRAWHADVDINPKKDFKAFMVHGSGTWMYNSTGTKHWICEKKIKLDPQGVLGVPPGVRGDGQGTAQPGR